MINKFAKYIKLSSQEGFSLIEILVAMGIFSVAILGMAVGAITITRANKTSQSHTVAANLAQDLLEQLRGLPITTVSHTNVPNGSVSVQGKSFTRTWTINPDPPVALGNNQITVTVTWTDYGPQSLSVAGSSF